ncbi:WEB family protein At2g38370-like isoform X2 [Phalaenopsis equestris]|uniref:WEB family protein At2g38370-like isoform X2 n=1 Tax=Phalaenopsis equestris TaxID=78828 RepID=UPI0009E495D2|nr:WEB family protein At2g38370-like isoform X2 [Phalaenopsis equestris]
MREAGSMLETLNVMSMETGGAGAEPPASHVRAKGPMMTRRAVIGSSVASMGCYGASAIWSPQLKELEPHQQTINVDTDFIAKEREKIAVLKELEINKQIANDLKLKLPKETSEFVQVADRLNSGIPKLHLNIDDEYLQNRACLVAPKTHARRSPNLILMELQKAKMNLASSTCGISGIRASIVLLKSMIAKEEAILEKSHESLRLNTAKVSFLEENLRKSTAELKLIEDAQSKHHKNLGITSNQITRLQLEKEGFKKIAEAAKADAARLLSEIEEIKIGIKAAEAAEAALLTEKAALSPNDSQNEHKLPSRITLSFEEYSELVSKARLSDEKSKKTIEIALARVRKASQSNHKLYMTVEEAIADVGASRKALKEAQKREEAANSEKLAAEEALHRWILKPKNSICAKATTEVESNRVMLKEALKREELVASRGKLAVNEDFPLWIFKQKHKISSVQNFTKFKNSTLVRRRMETRMLDVNGMSLINTGRSRRLSIGEILSIKLMDSEENEKENSERTIGRHRISLGQLLTQRNQLMSPSRNNVNNACTKFTLKKRKFGFMCLSLILANQNKSRKNQRQLQGTSFVIF